MRITNSGVRYEESDADRPLEGEPSDDDISDAECENDDSEDGFRRPRYISVSVKSIDSDTPLATELTGLLR